MLSSPTWAGRAWERFRDSGSQSAERAASGASERSSGLPHVRDCRQAENRAVGPLAVTADWQVAISVAFSATVLRAPSIDTDYVSSEPNWSPGDVVYAGGRPAYRITAVIPVSSLDDEVYDGIWEVEPV